MSTTNNIELTAAELARRTGFSRERIRQLTYSNSSGKSNQHPLKDFIDREKSFGNRAIYKQEAIGFLMNRKNYMEILFTPFRYADFINDNIITLTQLAQILNWTTASLRSHINSNKIRKEHYHLLKEKGYSVEPYIKRRDKIDY